MGERYRYRHPLPLQAARAEVSLMVELLRQSNRVELHGGDDLIVICFLLLLFC